MKIKFTKSFKVEKTMTIVNLTIGKVLVLAYHNQLRYAHFVSDQKLKTGMRFRFTPKFCSFCHGRYPDLQCYKPPIKV